ncbi:MAG: GNAT family N-acetyltransferase [Lachnospiraceae bacterium]|jgi:GNAT superfamily N-acetyltransferase|nr:GNAT family N-acetyltransferase [Lachnospiraceae bacterium]
MNVLIRNAKPEEIETLIFIEQTCFPAAEAAEPEQMKLRMKAFPEKFFVAQQGDTLAGFINGGVTDEPYLPDAMYHDISLHKPDGAYQTLFGLNVLPDYRRQGIAEKLLQALIESARAEGKTGVILTCKDHMVHYYTKAGFKDFGMADSTHGGQSWHDMRLIF